MPRFFEHVRDLRMRKQNPQLKLKRKVKLLVDTETGELTILEISHLNASPFGRGRPLATHVASTRQHGRDPADRDEDHVHDQPLTSALTIYDNLLPLGASLERELIRWQSLPLAQTSTSPTSFLQAVTRLQTGSRPRARLHCAQGKLALSAIADLRPTMPLASLNLDENQALSAWRFARQMPRPAIRAPS